MQCGAAGRPPKEVMTEWLHRIMVRRACVVTERCAVHTRCSAFIKHPGIHTAHRRHQPGLRVMGDRPGGGCCALTSGGFSKKAEGVFLDLAAGWSGLHVVGRASLSLCELKSD